MSEENYQTEFYLYYRDCAPEAWKALLKLNALLDTNSKESEQLIREHVDNLESLRSSCSNEGNAETPSALPIDSTDIKKPLESFAKKLNVNELPEKQTIQINTLKVLEFVKDTAEEIKKKQGHTGKCHPLNPPQKNVPYTESDWKEILDALKYLRTEVLGRLCQLPKIGNIISNLQFLATGKNANDLFPYCTMLIQQMFIENPQLKKL